MGSSGVRCTAADLLRHNGQHDGHRLAKNNYGKTPCMAMSAAAVGMQGDLNARTHAHTHSHTHTHTHTHTHNVLPVKTIEDTAIIIVCVRVHVCVKRSFHVKRNSSKACTSSGFLSLPNAHICSDCCHMNLHSRVHVNMGVFAW